MGRLSSNVRLKMPILPPKVVHRDRALRFLAELSNGQIGSEYAALQKAIRLQLSSAPTLLIFGTWMMCYLSRGSFWIGILLGASIISFGIIGLMTAERLVGLLKLFSAELVAGSENKSVSGSEYVEQAVPPKSDRAGG